MAPTEAKFLVFGKTGWIGGLVGDMLKQQGVPFEYATARLEDRAAVIADIERVRGGRGPQVVGMARAHARNSMQLRSLMHPHAARVPACLPALPCPGQAHQRPELRGPHRPAQRGLVRDAQGAAAAAPACPPPRTRARLRTSCLLRLPQHLAHTHITASRSTTHPHAPHMRAHMPPPPPKVETIRANVIGCLTLADVCLARDIHMTYYGTGCIFHYDDKFPENSGKGFKEEDTPNFTGSYYSHTKVRASSSSSKVLREQQGVREQHAPRAAPSLVPPRRRCHAGCREGLAPTPPAPEGAFTLPISALHLKNPPQQVS